MNILFIHPNFPGQFKHIINAIAHDPQYDVAFITQRSDIKRSDIRVERYRPRSHDTKAHRYLKHANDAVYVGQAVVDSAMRLRKSGFKPDLIVAHTGWGAALFLKDLFPNASLIGYFELFYRWKDSDIDFEPGCKVTNDAKCYIRLKNIVATMSLPAVDLGICPTHWQKKTFPEMYHQDLSIIHDGIDTSCCRPDANAVFTLADGTKLTHQDEIVTYVSRSLEPIRGFPSFMQAVEILARQRPKTRFLIVGRDRTSYSPKPTGFDNYREQLTASLELDSSRVHFLGKLSYADYLQLLRVSSAHVYLTAPIFLSWSMLEAMSTGCPVAASNTAPVTEAIENGVNGLLCDFHDPASIADAVGELLDDRERGFRLGEAARRTVIENYEKDHAVMRYKECFKAHMP